MLQMLLLLSAFACDPISLYIAGLARETIFRALKIENRTKLHKIKCKADQTVKIILLPNISVRQY